MAVPLSLKEQQLDLICSNWRVVYAIKREFVSLQNFFVTVKTKKIYVIQQRFAESFAFVDFVDEDEVHKEYLIKINEDCPFMTADGKHPINFLGNYHQCEQLLKQLKLDDIYQLPTSLKDVVTK